MLKLRNNKQGFSLIELLVTISIIGILAAVAVPAYNTYREDAKIGVLKTTTNIVAGALRTCLALKGNTHCKEFDNIQVKHDNTKITIDDAIGSDNDASICYNIISTTGTTSGFNGKANGCVDSAGTQAFCEWGSGKTSADSEAVCVTATGVCTPAGAVKTKCK